MPLHTTRSLRFAVALAAIGALAPAAEAQAQASTDGEIAFMKNCSHCHVGQMAGYAHAPRLAQLKQFPAARIREALVNGRMRPNTRFMSKVEIEAVILFLAASSEPAAPATAASN